MEGESDLQFSCVGGLTAAGAKTRVSFTRAIYWALRTRGPKTRAGFEAWSAQLEQSGKEVDHTSGESWVCTLANLRLCKISSNRSH